MNEKSSTVVLPGDVILADTTDIQLPDSIVIGPGLEKSGNQIIANRPGLLRRNEQKTLMWIDTQCRRYTPVKGDNVIGTVVTKLMDGWKVDIGSAELANLSYLAFEGATKRNRPNVQLGDILFATVLNAAREMEPELNCVDSNGKSGGYGVLSSNGFIFQVPLHVVRKMLSPNCQLQSLLGKAIKHEITYGMNGKILVHANKLKETVALARAISQSEYLSNEQMAEMVTQLTDELRGF